MDDLITLLSVSATVDEIGVWRETETRRPVWGHERSISRAEFAAAGQVGLSPALVLETAAINYEGEAAAEWRGVRYAIYRTYRAETSDMIELYMQREAGVTNGASG